MAEAKPCGDPTRRLSGVRAFARVKILQRTSCRHRRLTRTRAVRALTAWAGIGPGRWDGFRSHTATPVLPISHIMSTWVRRASDEPICTRSPLPRLRYLRRNSTSRSVTVPVVLAAPSARRLRRTGSFPCACRPTTPSGSTAWSRALTLSPMAIPFFRSSALCWMRIPRKKPMRQPLPCAGPNF